jgi:photosystem I subunit 6
MASAALAFTTTSIAASSFCGKQVAVSNKSTKSRRVSVRAVAPKAKYGDEGIYFDPKDVKNTTGEWDLYGADQTERYNGLQSKFFETFAGAFTKRGILLKFLVLGGAGTLGYLGATSGQDVLPIKKGPQTKPQPGPRGRL